VLIEIALGYCAVMLTELKSQKYFTAELFIKTSFSFYISSGNS